MVQVVSTESSDWSSKTACLDMQNLSLAGGHMVFKSAAYVNQFVKPDDLGCNPAALPVVPVTSTGLFT